MKTEAENQTGIATLDSLPNLHNAKVSPRELSSTYWTPEVEGEYKVGVIMEIKEENYTDDKSGETVKLPCIIMLNQEEDGSFNTIRNGSKRLVATIESAIESGELVLGQTPIRLSYLGKRKNKTNSYQSDRWSVKPIVL
ncbi:MAG: hypothetical protein CMC76_12220 [Flavobacteriaceae bacterium]|nr:hypothetical protein [Flavobacteriaceae bacterium]|tara:strand:+ start:5380 stop:5796 length:417 start_codon:yes stop_codon:yes gene_type:complete